MSEDAGIEPRTIATTVLAVRRSNHLAKVFYSEGQNWRLRDEIAPQSILKLLFSKAGKGLSEVLWDHSSTGL